MSVSPRYGHFSIPGKVLPDPAGSFRKGAKDDFRIEKRGYLWYA